MKRTVVFEKGMLLGMRCDLRVYVIAQRGTGDLELRVLRAIEVRAERKRVSCSRSQLVSGV